MVSDLNQQQLQTLKKAALRSVWVFLLFNSSLLLLFFLGNTEFVFIALVIQISIVVIWQLPVLIFHVVYKKQPILISIYKALASYRYVMEQVQWP